MSYCRESDAYVSGAMVADNEHLSSEEKTRHACGVFAVVLNTPTDEIHRLLYDANTAQQHRGQEAAGSAYATDGTVKVYKGVGLVSQATPYDTLDGYPPAPLGMGHVRYSVTGKPSYPNAQPYLFQSPVPFAIGHNGNVLWDVRPQPGEPTTDSFGIGRRISAGNGSFEKSAITALSELNGAYTLTFLTPDAVYVAVDPWGFRRPHVGHIARNGKRGNAVASESVGLYAVGADDEGMIPRGAFVKITPDEIVTIWEDPRVKLYKPASCSFEGVYFADAASQTNIPAHERLKNHTIRARLGREVAKQATPGADFVAPVPMSGWSYAEGASMELRLPLRQVIHVNRHVGRNFIKPQTPDERMEATFQKYHFIDEEIKGNKLIIVDDSTVRGNTLQGLVMSLLKLGAERVEVLIGIPPIRDVCHWGVDFQEYNDLIYHVLMSQSGNASYEDRLAVWLSGGREEWVEKIFVKFQKMENFVSLSQGVPLGTPEEDAGACFHCLTGKVPDGIIAGTIMYKGRFDDEKIHGQVIYSA